ncbi:uncharacterized protein LOC114726808 [Neltuma alba]|uniref:uncharacterized protein LOC114726808 n=1 Tax=Neltuma alba TaxID=207710 RepID=UPI0010A30B4C|nr:uncharacterized protein LOC114726808 [Prosopis alba]
MSESSNGCMHCTTEQIHEVLYLDYKIGEAHNHAEILQAKTVLPEVTKNEEVTKNADVMVPVTMVSQTSQQASCTHPSISKSIVVDVEDQTELLKTQTINLDIGLCSAEKDESNSGSTLRNQALEKKVVKVEEASSTLPHPKSSRDCVFGKTSKQPSPNPEEKDFVFGDFGEYRFKDQHEE